MYIEVNSPALITTLITAHWRCAVVCGNRNGRCCSYLLWAAIHCSPSFLAGGHRVRHAAVEELPTVSVAVTTNVLVPMDDVLMDFRSRPARTRRHPAPPSLQA